MSKLNSKIITLLIIIALVLSMLFSFGKYTNTITSLENDLKNTQHETENQIDLLKEQIDTKNYEINELSKMVDLLTIDRDSLSNSVNNLQEQIIQEKRIFDHEKAFLAERYLSRKSITMEELQKELGKPKKIWETMAVEGYLTILEYDNSSFTFGGTIENPGYLAWFSFTDNFIITQHGITIGNTRQEVYEAYGSDYHEEGNNKLVYGDKMSGVRFTFTNNILERIDIWYTYE